jgi:HD-GYP domain-containing protein (c-di-GMP phosphodiesterase class II)
VCDAFDAMTSERAYSGAIPHTEALAELHACAGTQFDPLVVAAFMATFAEPSSVHADDGEHALAAGQHHGGLLAGAAPDEGAGHGGLR